MTILVRLLDPISEVEIASESVPTLRAAMQGPPGLSAYEVAVANGFVGTEEEWLDSLGGGGGGVTDHGALTGLADDDHPQYLLASGARAMTGALAMGGNAITGVSTVDGRDVSADGAALDAHVAASNPHAGSLGTAHEGAGGAVHAVAIASGAAGFMSGADKAKLDGVAAGADVTPLSSTTPAAVGVAAVGVGTTVARADHVHAHGDQAGGSLHAAATTSVAGFMSAADKTKLDGVAAGATATPLASTTPAALGTAAVGVGTTAARADHVHAHGNQAGGALHADVVAGGASGFMSGADKTKLDGIEANADVTDAANVNAAGAVMESDFTATHTILMRQSGATPVAVAIPLSTFVGRIASGDIIPMTVAQAKTLLGYAASEIAFTPDGDIAASNVQAAIAEVRNDTDTKLGTKAALYDTTSRLFYAP